MGGMAVKVVYSQVELVAVLGPAGVPALVKNVLLGTWPGIVGRGEPVTPRRSILSLYFSWEARLLLRLRP